MKPHSPKTYIGILLIVILGLALFLTHLIPKSHSCSYDYDKEIPKSCDILDCHQPVDPADACFSAGCMAGTSMEDAMAKCNCDKGFFNLMCNGAACRCKCDYKYCSCGKLCCESDKICGKERDCRWQGKEPWLELRKPERIPEELRRNYNQGLSMLKEKKWADAIPVLERAIDAEYIDRRGTNRRDLAYEEFFPRRELGIAQYRLANYPESIKALRESLKGEETAKAQFYLNSSRGTYLKQTQADKRPPEISIGSPTGLEYVNKLQGIVEGKVRDDFFVSEISVNGKKLPLWLAQKTVPFKEKIPLAKGLNEIHISASDLTGKTSREKVSIYADTDGPLISINHKILEQTPTSRKILITGGISDDTYVQEIIIQNNIISSAPAKEVALNELVILPKTESGITIQAKDRLGNITRGNLLLWEPKIALLSYIGNLAYYGGLLKKIVPPRLYSTVRNKFFAKTTPASPVIEFKDIVDGQSVFFADIYIEGKISSANDIVSLSINGERFANLKGSNIFFSTVLKLKEGKNKILVEAQDITGKSFSKEIILYRKIPKAKTIGSRMCITITPFEKPGTASQLKDIVYDQLISAFINQKRFNLVERNRLEEILLEQKLSQTKLVKKTTVMRLGQILAADAVMIGTIYETDQTIEIYARLVDTETGVIIESKDVCCGGKGQEDIKLLTEGLALKFKNSFPIVEGLVIKRDGKDVFQDLGTQLGMKPYRRLIAYREQEPIIHPVTQKNMGVDTFELGEIMLKKVFNHMSRGDIIREKEQNKIKPKDKVIAK